MQTADILKRIDFVLAKGVEALTHTIRTSDFMNYVETGPYAGFRSAALSFVSSLTGESSTYYKEFDRQVKNTYVSSIEAGISILQSLRSEVELGWLTKFKQLVTAEIFSDFLEMSKYFLDQKYKDAAAVMIGSVLEEHLRQLCVAHSVDVLYAKGNDIIPKKADLLNSDLAKAGIYSVLEQKNVTALLDLRNRAAHGKYSEYNIEQVNLMYLGVLDFVSRIK